MTATKLEPEYWKPLLGETVWLNYPDAKAPMGVVIGFVPEGEHRAGQPIIECQEDEPPPFGKKKGDRFCIHPVFLLPFEYGGSLWKLANAEGRIG
jgi:hypothetical protein